MLSGFNTNVQHRGVVFHVQTEDSGRAHPHVITHLYFKGTILASEKSEYADKLASCAGSELTEAVKQQMESQHQSMLGRLRKGEFDGVIRERLGDVLEGTSPTVQGGDTTPTVRATASKPPAAPSGAPPPARKQLDQQIFDYLVESARKRKRRAP